MNDELTFEYKDGTIDTHEITVYALSTCGFCKRALKFLMDNSIKYRFVFVDNLDPEVKERLKTYLKERFNDRVAYPFVIINEEKHLVGFIEDDWKKEMGLE